ncbi:TIGR03808 family TAT-translocated repetitive protein [Rhodobium gokarnense]|uniref:Secreted repeat protein (TIGR03808 family) n=1 Tax=Rhodobium gokarnense TaxID=364296 RepID=A0ABT3HC34_9HYPH|nr:TIGR03808 family TAT-translocated repetitive protein [Rhodobium gokarnense]MCW2307955.1 putative secreted repeat protein (TIGR03808 family) [Rhodobium gokarnense]
MLDRRSFLTAGGGFAAAALAPAAPARANIEVAELRGSLDASHFGARPGAVDDQSRILQMAIDQATREHRPLFIPPGRYQVSNLTLPDGAQIVGIPDETQLVYQGGGHFLLGEKAERLSLEGIVIDGSNRLLEDYAPGLVHFIDVERVTIANCSISGSAMNGISLHRCGGRIERSTVSGAGQAAIQTMEAKGLAIRDNVVTNCANGGILVHRWTEGDDGTLVTGNRVEEIYARDGGTGQNGNGINVFRAHNVMVANNRVANCAFSAIRSNAGSNVQITANSCLKSGETAIYSEFAFEGAVISDNIVDGGANGISVVNFREGGRLATVSGNLVRNMSTIGPYTSEPPGFGSGIAAEGDTTIANNVVENVPLFGLALGWGPHMRNVTATGNIVRNAKVGIAVSVVDGVGPAVVANNILEETADGAIIGFRWADRASDDLVDGGGDAFAGLTVANNVAR